MKEPVLSCPIRGHLHTLTCTKELTQDGTGAKAGIWKCLATGRRWFVLDGRCACESLELTPEARRG